MQQWYDEEFGPTGTLNGGAYAGKSYWVCTEYEWEVIYAAPTYTGQNYPVDEGVYGQSGGFGNGYVPLFIVVGYRNKVYYDDNDGCTAYDVEGLRTALRLAIDEMPAPPVMTLSDTSFNPTAAPEASIGDSFDMGNTGAGPLDYSFSIDYDGVVAPGSTWESNDFNTVLGYTNSGAGNWAVYAGGTWNDGSNCANAADAASSIMTSDVFSTLGVGDALWLEFRYGTSATTGSALIAEYFDGSSWVELWNYTGSGVGTKKIELPVKSANTQLRFTGISKRVQGVWSIERLDDIKVYSDDQAYRWLLFDTVDPWGQPDVVGTIAASGSDTFNLNFSAFGLAEGTYNADIVISSNYTPETVKSLPVVFTVSGGGAPIVPATPSNISTSISGTDLVVDWDVSADATGYDVYSSNDPYGTFTLASSVSTNQYTVAADQAKLFYYIVATNSTKKSDNTITVKSIKK